MKKNMLNVLVLKRAKVLLGMLALSTAVSFSGCGKKEDRKPFSDVVAEVSDETCFDEYIEKNALTLVEDADKLIKYIELSEEMNELLKRDVIVTKTQLENEKLLQPGEISTLIDDYKKETSDDDLLYKIVVQKALTDYYIQNEGFEIAADLEIIALKAVFADSFGFNDTMDVSLGIFDQIKIPGIITEPDGSPDEEPIPETMKLGEYTYKINGYRNYLSQIYDLQEISKKAGSYEYNEEKNEMIISAFDNSEELLNGPRKQLKRK